MTNLQMSCVQENVNAEKAKLCSLQHTFIQPQLLSKAYMYTLVCLKISCWERTNIYIKML